MKPWKRDLAYIREVGPDEPRFDEAVQRVWERCEDLEEALLRIAENDTHWKDRELRTAQQIAREALS